MTWPRDLWDTFRSIGIADLLDILVMACLLYVVLLWFKRAKAAFVARGIFIFAMFYVVARQSGMYLTTWMFEGFFASFLIALVVIFQEELRSFFERLAVWSLRRPLSRRFHTKKEVEVLVRAVGEFARRHIGALIVLRGLDPLERHLEGGIDLHGELSGALLDSLFDTHSEGHDGAIIVEGDRVVKFGVHLPLSKEFYKLTGVGTRHTAALGLAERTDALCLVVSEERGKISIARDGDIRVVENLMLLEEELTTFLKEKAPVKLERQWRRDLFKRNLTEKLLATTVAVALWLVFVQGFSPATQAFQVPVEVRSVPEGLQLTRINPTKSSVRLRGLSRDLKLLNPLSLRVVLDLTGAQPGPHRIPISERNLEVPGAIQLDSVNPPIVELELAAARENSEGLLDIIFGEGGTPDQPQEAEAEVTDGARQALD